MSRLLISLGLFVLLFVTGSVEFTGFGSARVFLNLFTDNAFLAITAFGMTFVILSGGIDLSVGAVMALSGVICALLIEHLHWSPFIVFPLVLFGGSLLGAIMGWLIYEFKLQAFIVTLAGMFFARGLALALSDQSISVTHPIISQVNQWGIELPGHGFLGAHSFILFFIFAVVIYLAHYTRFGRYVYAIGGNLRSAQLMGVPCAQVTVGIYALSSFFATLAGIIFMFYTASGYAQSAVGMELDTIAAVVIGGTLLTGGSGLMAGTLIGVMVMGLIQTWISFNGQLSSWWTKIIIGALLLVFIGLQRLLDSSFLGSSRFLTSPKFLTSFLKK